MRPVSLPAVLAIAAAMSLTMAGAAGAHHSAAAYDMTQTVEVSGAVKTFEWINPHLEMVVETASGPWEVEGSSPAQLGRMGWKRDAIKVGDRVDVYLAPRRDGVKRGFVTTVVLADGTTLGKPVPTRQPNGQLRTPQGAPAK